MCDRRLVDAICRAWAADTSSDMAWTPDQPSTGQCAVTALVVQDYCGGLLVRAVVGGQSHYWNRLPDGHVVDLTRDQFASFKPTNRELRSRDYVLSFPATAARYLLLANRVRNNVLMERVVVTTDF